MKILLFADSSPTIGSGHVIRSLVLARELSDLGDQVVLAGTGATLLKDSFESLKPVPSVELETPFDTMERIKTIGAFSPDFVVVDGYEFQQELYSFLGKKNIQYAVIDDGYRSRAPEPAIVLDQGTDTAPYKALSAVKRAKILSGSEYRLFRKEILSLSTYGRSSASIQNVMVAFGGSDVLRLTMPVTLALAESGFDVVAAIGGNVENRDDIKSALLDVPRIEVTNQESYEKKLSESDLAVVSAGTSMWESLFLGNPTIAVIVADNQEKGSRLEARSNELLEVLDARAGGKIEREVLAAVRQFELTRASRGKTIPRAAVNSSRNAAIAIHGLLSLSS